MNQIEAAKELLEIVEVAIQSGDWVVDGACDPDLAIQRVRQAITEAEKQKPVTWKPDRSGKFLTVVYKDIEAGNAVGEIIEHPKCCAVSWSHALQDVNDLKIHYTNPQPRKSLTFDQVEDCFGDGFYAEENGILVSAQWLHDFARAIEAAHGIKENT